MMLPSTAHADSLQSGEVQVSKSTDGAKEDAVQKKGQAPKEQPEPEQPPKEEAPKDAAPKEKTPDTKQQFQGAAVTGPLEVTLSDHVVAPGATVVGNIDNADPNEPVRVDVLTATGSTVTTCGVDMNTNPVSFSCALPANIEPGGDYTVVAYQGDRSAAAQLVVSDNDGQERPMVDAPNTMQFSDITITGVGWDPDTRVDLTLTGPDGATISRSGLTVDSNGKFIVAIPTDASTAPGDWTVFVDSTTGTQASQWLTLEIYAATPRTTCTRSIIRDSESAIQTVNLSGFTPDGTPAEIVAIGPDGLAMAGLVIPLGERGTASWSFPVPTTSPGRWTIETTQHTSEGETNTGQCSFTVVGGGEVTPPEDPEKPPVEEPEKPGPGDGPIAEPLDPDDPDGPGDGEDDGDDLGGNPDTGEPGIPPPTFDPDDPGSTSLPTLVEDLFGTTQIPEANEKRARIIEQPRGEAGNTSPDEGWHAVDGTRQQADDGNGDGTGDGGDNRVAEVALWSIGTTGALGVAGWMLFMGLRRRNDFEA
ncbi:MAG: hypothetical protein L0H93_11790 [Nocardioides sp.]|nr:hypothetical protein [Nocardioides sp.]